MSIEALTIRVAENKVSRNQLIARFKRAILYDLAITDYLSLLRQTETAIDSSLNQALDQVVLLIRKTAFSAYTDILDYGDPIMIRHATGALGVAKKYSQGELPGAILFGEEPSKAIANICRFVREIQTPKELSGNQTGSPV